MAHRQRPDMCCVVAVVVEGGQRNEASVTPSSRGVFEKYSRTILEATSHGKVRVDASAKVAEVFEVAGVGLVFPQFLQPRLVLLMLWALFRGFSGMSGMLSN